ncbi:MAG: PQQ-dependent sugar dehydrogenase [Alphaproteobacteria bacterium]|nr:PQQ-dependent sugar dehydrogenase [Alphaproteobacteria bacterium]
MVLFLVACAPGRTPAPEPSDTVKLTEVAAGLEKATDIAFQGGRMVVTTQPGRLAWVEGGKTHTWRQIDVVDGSERGLLGVAFDPDYSTNGRVVLSWTEKVHEQTVSRIGIWTTTPGSKPGDAPLEPGPVLFELVQPWSNHNGGGVQFGPDGMLYVGFGDGGKGGDPLESGQDGSTALGAMLRLDPDLPAPHVPPDNPFVGDPSTLDAIWAIGLRNPWRFSFAPDGRIVAGDVGQNLWEELTFVPRGGNCGWNLKEGRSCFARTPCDGAFVEPFWVYGRDQGQSITGGYVATAGPLAGKYVFGDFSTGTVWATPLPETGSSVDRVETVGDWDFLVSTFGRDADGQIYVADFGNGRIFRIDGV